MIKAATLQIKPQFTPSAVTENTISRVSYLTVFFDEGKSRRITCFHVPSKSGN